MIEQNCDGPRRVNIRDWAVALSIAVFGIMFLVPIVGMVLGFDEIAGLGAELWTLGNYVYIVVVGVCLTVLVLGVVRRYNRK